MLNNGFKWRALWSYLVGSNQPPKPELVEHGRLEHLHLDRSSGQWIDHEEAREETAA